MRYNAAFTVRLLFNTGVLLVLLGIFPVGAQNARSHAVVIGIRRYAQYPLTPPLLYSANDAQVIRDFMTRTKQPRVDARDLALLTDEAAGRQSMEMALRKALLGAGEGDYVYIFISARGIARPGAADGYLGTADLVEVKPESTGLPVSDIREWIRYSKAKRVFLFADVCRDPLTLPFENRINLRLEELGTLPALAGILASEREHVSFEKKELPPQGLGVFTYALVDAMPGTGTNIASIFEKLRRVLPTAALPHKQMPQQIGKSADARTASLWLAPPGRATNADVLLASAWFVPGLLAVSQSAMPAEIRSPQRLDDPESVVADIQRMRPTLRADEWEDLRDRAAAALADSGQRVVTAYGLEDLLPEDPRKLQARDFQRASLSFTAAATLLSSAPEFESYRAQLGGLAEFCRGRALAFDRTQMDKARTVLRASQSKMRKPIPEIENALGITYLEEGSDYAAAVEHFRAAKHASPGWPYPRHNLALAYTEQGDRRAAEREYREALRELPDQPYLHYNLGLLLQRMNRKKDARRELTEAGRRLTTRAQVYAQRSGEWSTTLTQQAAEAGIRASLLLRARGDVENALGAVNESLGDYGEAEAAYWRALDADPALCPARHNLALLLHNRKRGDPLPLLRENVKQCENFHPSIVLLAQLHLEHGNRDQARAGFERALALAPQNAESALGLARIMAAEKHFDRAANTLEVAILRSEPAAHPLLYVELANVYEAQASSLACDAYRRAATALKGTQYKREKMRFDQKVQQCSD